MVDQLSFPPGHHYSPIPDFENLPAVVRDRTTLPGIDVRYVEQLALLKKLADFQSDMPFEDRASGTHRYYFMNEYYAAADGIVYYSMLRYLRPRQLIEIGSGFSSALALDVNELFFDSSMRCTFVDPNGSRLRSLLRPGDANIELIERPVQELPTDFASRLGANDVLFIDSSHVSRTGSDVGYLYHEVLPQLARGVWVHIHDTFWPFEYPVEYLERKWAWNELYLLRALLCGSRDFEIALFPSYLEANHKEALGVALPLALTACWHLPSVRGASIWLKRV